MARKTTEQKINETEKRLAQLKKQQRSQENSQKIIVGGMVLAHARKPQNGQMRQWLLKTIPELVTRKADIERVQPVIDELQAIEREHGQQQPAQHEQHGQHGQ